MKTFFSSIGAGIIALLAAGQVDAQIVPATGPHAIADFHDCTPPYTCHTDASVSAAHTLNCDMHDLYQGLGAKKFFAIGFTVTDVGRKDMGSGCFFFDPTPAYASGVRIEQGPGDFMVGTRDICLPPQAHPDVVIGNDYLSGDPSSFYVGVVYLNTNNEVEILNCHVTNVGSTAWPNWPNIGTPSAGVRLSTPGRTVTSKPHIDMFGDGNGAGWWNGKPLRKYFATWSERDISGVNYIMGAFGDLATLSITVITITPDVPGAPQGIHPDVGCMELMTPAPDDRAYVTYLDPSTNDLLMSEVNLFGYGGGGGFNYTTHLPPIDLGTNYTSIEPPRIEAQAYADVVPGVASWQIVAAADPGTGFTQIHTYNDANAPTYTPTIISVSPTDQHFSAAVAGVGPAMATGGQTNLIGQDQFSISYYSQFTNNPPNPYPGHSLASNSNGDVYSNYVNIANGLCPNTALNYEVNTYTLLHRLPHTLADNTATAITSSSNTGDDLMTVWYQGFSRQYNWGMVQYKIANGVYGFRPLSMQNDAEAPALFDIYPNPAYDQVTIQGVEGMSYTITDVLGKQHMKGKTYSSKHRVYISQLPPGFYIMNLDMNGEQITRKFVKE